MDRPPDDAHAPQPHPPDPEHPAHPTGAGTEEEPRRTDLLSIALLVFFVALIGIVGAMLLLPVLY
jgi:hypothetical protein